MVTSPVDLVNDDKTDEWWSWIAGERRLYLASIITIVTIAYTNKVNNKCGSERIIGIAVIQNWEEETQSCPYNAEDH